jgi:hypothetical protein
MIKIMEKLVFPLYFNYSVRSINAKNKHLSLQIRCETFIYVRGVLKDTAVLAYVIKAGHCMIKSSGLVSVYLHFTHNK